MVTGAAGGHGVAVDLQWRDIEPGGVIILLPSEAVSPAEVIAERRIRVMSPFSKSKYKAVGFYLNATLKLLGFVCRQETCDNDDDFTVGWKDELPPGVQGCLRPQSPPNSFLRVTHSVC